MSKCIGCGIKLQSIDGSKPGYIPVDIVQSEQGECYCQRCFKIRNYHLKYNLNKTVIDNLEILKTIPTNDSLFVVLIDCLDPKGGFFDGIDTIVMNRPVILVLNKLDLLPRSLNTRFINEFVFYLASKRNMNVIKTIEISAMKQIGIDKLIQSILNYKYIKKYGKIIETFKDAYVLGTTSVGKSTLMNTLSSLYLNDNSNKITTSDQYQTTLGFIKMTLDKNCFIIDTPGVINPFSYGTYLDYNSLVSLTPGKFIHERTFNLSIGNTLFLGALASIDVLSEQVSITFYGSEKIICHRTKTENRQDLLVNQHAKLLTPPMTLEEFDRVQDWDDHFIDILYEYNDIFISGIGLLHFKAKGGKINIRCFNKISIDYVQKEML